MDLIIYIFDTSHSVEYYQTSMQRHSMMSAYELTVGFLCCEKAAPCMHLMLPILTLITAVSPANTVTAMHRH